LIFLALFFFPIAVYCLLLGMINRRPHPVMVSGSWDFFGLLLAASGLILFGGPALLTIYYDREIRDFLLGRFHLTTFPFHVLFLKWWGLWLLYYLIVVGGGAFLVWWRGSKTSIYNVEPLVFDDTLAGVLDRLGVEWTRMGNRVFIGFRNRNTGEPFAGPESVPGAYQVPIRPAPAIRATPTPFPAALPADQEAVLDIEPFYTTRHVTLNWRSGNSLIREPVEAELGRALTEVRSRDNPMGGWLMIIASSLFALIFFGVALTILVQLKMQRPM
jgi:hypothetical protein